MHPNDILAIVHNPQRSPTDVERLAALLNQLVAQDFAGLVYLLYRVDVPEQQVRSLLQNQPHADAGDLLATLLLQRQAQKEQSRQQWRQQDTDIPDEERW